MPFKEGGKEGDTFREELTKLHGEPGDLRVNADLKTIGDEYIAKLKHDIRKMTSLAAFLSDFLYYKGYPDYMTVETTIENLTDQKEIDKLIHEIRPESRFHGSRVNIADLVELLRYFWDKNVYARNDTLAKALRLLEEKKTEEQDFINRVPPVKKFGK